MNIDLDIGKILIASCTFIITVFINRNIKRIDSMSEKIDQLGLDMAELRGSISGRFIINDVKAAEVQKLRK